MYRLLIPIAWSVSLLAAEQPPRALTLRGALETAEKLSPDVQLARLGQLEAEAATRNARSGYLPQLNAVVNGTYQTINLQGIGLFFPGVDGRVGPFRTFNARPVLTQTVLDLSLLSTIRAAREREKERRFDAATAKEATLLAVAQLYLQAQQAESRIAAAEARRKTAEAVLAQAREFESAGTASKLDVARAEQQYQTEDVSVTEARRDRETLATLLLRTIGLEQGPVSLEAPRLAVTKGDGLPVDRPEMRAIESRIRSSALDRQRAGRERYPKLAFAGDYGASGAGPERSIGTYNVGATLTISLWTSGRIESDVQAAAIRLRRAETEKRSLELRIEQEVRQARLESEAALVALASAERATRAARESLELSRLRFASGIATNLDTITAQGILAQAEDQEIRLRYEYFLARARAARASGNVYALLD